MISGILIINKSAGPTSHDIVDRIRKISGIKQIGHAGTLDPFAEGVLIVLVGKTTKLQSRFMDLPKTYIATLRLGAVSNTYDKTGDIELSEIESPIVRDQVLKVLKDFIGEIKQTPPAFSAVKIKGKKAYELARKGIKPKLKPRKVKIYDIQCRKYWWPASTRSPQFGEAGGGSSTRGRPKLEIEVKCGKGTYIRSLANDIGKKLGCGAYLEKLIRTEIGKFNIKNSIKLNELNPKNLPKKIISDII